MLRALVFLAGFSVVFCYQAYKTKIPNGDRVPNPCSNSPTWSGVGHLSPTGAGTLNPFGQALLSATLVWSTPLCHADSDGDGKSNGEELGDPNCIWHMGNTPTQAPSGHPGICEPLDSPKCIENNAAFVSTCDYYATG